MSRSRGFALLALLATCAVQAQSQGGDFAITRQAIAGGGGRSQADAFVLESTIAQATAVPATGGGFTLSGGFQQPTGASQVPGSDIFSNGFED